eukprot:UN05178
MDACLMPNGKTTKRCGVNKNDADEKCWKDCVNNADCPENYCCWENLDKCGNKGERIVSLMCMGIIASIVGVVCILIFYCCVKSKKKRIRKRTRYVKQPRIIILGNWKYKGRFSHLKNVRKDINKVESSFKRLGFETLVLKNKKRNELLDVFEKYSKLIQEGPILFYYAGHGGTKPGKPHEQLIVCIDGQFVELCHFIT